MSKILFSLALIATFVLPFTACKKEVILDREQFLGSYNGSRACNISGNSTYNWSVEVSAVSTTKVLLKNFTNNGATDIITADVSGTTITIPAQSYSIGAFTYQIQSGSGSIAGNTLTVNYTYTFDSGIGSVTETCTVTSTKL